MPIPASLIQFDVNQRVGVVQSNQLPKLEKTSDSTYRDDLTRALNRKSSKDPLRSPRDRVSPASNRAGTASKFAENREIPASETAYERSKRLSSNAKPASEQSTPQAKPDARQPESSRANDTLNDDLSVSNTGNSDGTSSDNDNVDEPGFSIYEPPSENESTPETPSDTESTAQTDDLELNDLIVIVGPDTPADNQIELPDVDITTVIPPATIQELLDSRLSTDTEDTSPFFQSFIVEENNGLLKTSVNNPELLENDQSVATDEDKEGALLQKITFGDSDILNPPAGFLEAINGESQINTAASTEENQEVPEVSTESFATVVEEDFTNEEQVIHDPNLVTQSTTVEVENLQAETEENSNGDKPLETSQKIAVEQHQPDEQNIDQQVNVETFTAVATNNEPNRPTENSVNQPVSVSQSSDQAIGSAESFASSTGENHADTQSESEANRPQAQPTEFTAGNTASDSSFAGNQTENSGSVNQKISVTATEPETTTAKPVNGNTSVTSTVSAQTEIDGVTKTGQTNGRAEVNPQQIVDRVTTAVRQASQNGGQLKIRLNPPELGVLQVEVSTRNGVLSVTLQVQTSSAQQALTENLSLLHDAFSQNGMNVDRVDVHLGDSETNDEQSEFDENPENYEEQLSEQQQEQEENESEQDNHETEKSEETTGSNVGQLDIEI